MDLAVSMVQAYLRLNGYFTVTEFPVVEAVEGPGYRAATDIDVLACRFPRAAREVVGEAGGEASVDPALEVPVHSVDMIVGEVKESRAVFNAPGLRTDVLAATLTRFGCCPAPHAKRLVSELVATGSTTTEAGHHMRLVAFGSETSDGARYTALSLWQVHDWLERYVRDHWEAFKAIQPRDRALGWLTLREKLRRVGEGGDAGS